MLSYRHSYHAGNHGDVLKHWCLVTMLDYLNQKDKPYLYMDTHAGAGSYHLQEQPGKKVQEYLEGIYKLLRGAETEKLPESLTRYCELIRSSGEVYNRKIYPGSPKIAETISRECDRLRFFELHPADSKKLLASMKACKRAKVEVSDGLQAVKALLPPKEKRGLIMIDPSYEVKAEYFQVIKALQEGLKRFQNGVYAIWYPMLNHVENIQFQEKLNKFDGAKWINLQLIVDNQPGAKGMYGSGMFIANPPWVLTQAANEVLPALANLLGQEGRGEYRIVDSGNL